jgi:hypothetical protein
MFERRDLFPAQRDDSKFVDVIIQQRSLRVKKSCKNFRKNGIQSGEFHDDRQQQVGPYPPQRKLVPW